MKTFVLGSAASLLLAGAAFAQSDMNPPQVSTPAEKQQTQQLNGQAADGTTATPAQLNGTQGDGSAAMNQAPTALPRRRNTTSNSSSTTRSSSNIRTTSELSAGSRPLRPRAAPL
ncbi:MAG: hypothetical protein WDM89_19260 [Rhizomicrobium sp.]